MNAPLLMVLAAWSVQPQGGACLLEGPIGIYGEKGSDKVAVIVDHPEGNVSTYQVDGKPTVTIQSEHRIGPQVAWLMPPHDLAAAASITLDGEQVIEISHVPVEALDACYEADPGLGEIIWEYTSDPLQLPLEGDTDFD